MDGSRCRSTQLKCEELIAYAAEIADTIQKENGIFANGFFGAPSCTYKLTSHYQGFRSLERREIVDLQVGAVFEWGGGTEGCRYTERASNARR